MGAISWKNKTQYIIKQSQNNKFNQTCTRSHITSFYQRGFILFKCVYKLKNKIKFFSDTLFSIILTTPMSLKVSLHDKWNMFSKLYASKYEPSNLLQAQCLANMLKISNYKNILEVGCGSGMLTVSLLPKLALGAKYISSDFSEEMLFEAEKRKRASRPFIPKDVQHEFMLANCEDLRAIPDESIDCYIAPLVINNVDNPV